MYRLIALLDKPSIESFGMVPLLVRKDGEERLYVYRGAKDAPPTTHSDREFRMMTHHMRVVEVRHIRFEEEPVDKVAGWLGMAFLANSRRLGLPDPDVTGDYPTYVFGAADQPLVSEGVFWFASPDDVFARLEIWLLFAAKEAFRRKSAEVAGLMHWCLPMRDETQAAIWYTAPDDKRHDLLTWSLRMFLPYERGLTREALKKRFEGIVVQYLRDT